MYFSCCVGQVVAVVTPTTSQPKKNASPRSVEELSGCTALRDGRQLQPLHQHSAAYNQAQIASIQRSPSISRDRAICLFVRLCVRPSAGRLSLPICITNRCKCAVNGGLVVKGGFRGGLGDLTPQIDTDH